jgi:hypothetical protein
MRGEKEQLMEEILNWLRENNLKPTVKNVLDLNYMGDVKSLRQLEEDYPEDYAELMECIRDGTVKR